jgi:5-hydroxyisourate hydrolase-like protein (transthyretin family)
MVASKVDEVGQMRRSSGTSMKRITKEKTLRDGRVRGYCEFGTRVGQGTYRVTMLMTSTST